MATENKRVAAYLPQPLYDLLETFKEENDLSESKAIISILAAHFGIAQEVSQKVTQKFVTMDQFIELQSKVAHMSELLSDLRDTQAHEGEAISERLGDTPIPGQTSIFEVQSFHNLSQSSGELEGQSLEPRSAQLLVNRFPDIGTYQSITNAKNRYKDDPSKLTEWTRKKDEEGVGWRFDEVDKLYHAVP